MTHFWQTFLAFRRRYNFQKKYEVIALTLGGFFGSLFELLGISIVFPLMSIIIQPQKTLKIPILAHLSAALGFTDAYAIAVFLIIAVIAVYVTKAIFLVAFNHYELRVLARWRINISTRIYKGFMEGQYEKFMRQGSNEIINYITVIVPYVVNNFVYQLINLMQIGLTALFLCSYVFYLSPGAIILVTVCGGSMILGLTKLQRRAVRRLGNRMSQYSMRQFSVLQQSIAGYKETKVHSKEDFFFRLFQQTAQDSAINESRILFVQTLPQVLVELMVILLIVSCFMVMLLTSRDLSQSAAQIALLVVLGVRFIPLINRSITAITLINSSGEAVDQLFKIHDLLGLAQEEDSPAAGQAPQTDVMTFDDKFELKNISYRYHADQPNGLEDISFSLKPGDFIGITGPSGGGKTTLVNIMLGFLTNFQGTYRIDGRDVEPGNIRSLRQITGLVDQHPFIITGDFIDNVAFGESREEVDYSRIEDSLKKSQLWDFVQSNPEKLSFNLGENGKFLSGGQRQRVAIARALYRDIKILILDEASSALDVENELQFFEYLATLKGQLTVIMIAHRLSTLKSCSRILFVDGGRLVDSGSFSDLYHSNARFKKYVDYSNIKIHDH